jgi:polyisoprenoid-binding protein YceI
VREAAKGWTAEGVLTVHGVDAPVTLAVELVASTTDSATLRATGTLSRSAHGVSKMKPMVPDKVAVDITAYLTR